MRPVRPILGTRWRLAERGGEKATDKVWESAEGLEWTLPSPAPYHSFPTPPKVN